MATKRKFSTSQIDAIEAYVDSLTISTGIYHMQINDTVIIISW